MWVKIWITFVFSCIVVVSAKNETEMSNRYFFENAGNGNGCFTRNRQPGRCIGLRSCQSLKELIDHVPPMYLLSALSEYICGFDGGGIFRVCCPNGDGPQNRRPVTSRPQKQTSTESNWGRPNVDTRRPFRTTTQKPTTTGWERPTRRPVNKPTRQTPKPTETENGEITNHRNRRLLPQDCGIEVANKIIGGKEASLEEYPWMALLRVRLGSGRTVFSCGGSLITSRYVLTAAHCLRSDRLPVTAVIDQVRLGEHDQNEDLDCVGSVCSDQPDDVEIEERIVHPNYSPKDPSSKNDIALVRLKRPARLSSYVQPICLPLDGLRDKNFEKQEMWTAGWGRTTNARNSQSHVKLKIRLPIVPLEDCVKTYKSDNIQITDKQICAGGRANEDSCNGDSGGPLMRQDIVGSTVRWHIQGIVSFGPESCGKLNSPGIYTKVGKYLDWILDNIRD